MIDWNNIDLDSPCERDLNILDPYNFETLLLEIHCNIADKEINEKSVNDLFQELLNAKVVEARQIFKANLKNIVKYSKDYNKSLE